MGSHTKPPVVCYLKPGKAVGAHANFAATFNWLVDWCWNFKVRGKHLEFAQLPDSAHPVVKYVEDGDEDPEPGGDGKIKLTGTDGSSAESKEFTFSAAAGSNVSVSVSGTGIVIGVYYT